MAEHHTARPSPPDPRADQPVLWAVAVGNTRTAVGVFVGDQLASTRRWLNADHPDPASQVQDIARAHPPRAVALASTNPQAADAFDRACAPLALPDPGVFRIGTDLPVPIQHNLSNAATVGQDRLLCALGAYARAQQACVVIDAGTAVTVDFVDGEGVFQGGAILPGLAMMLRALHEHTASLPLLQSSAEPPTDTPWGRETAPAIIVGVRAAIIGAVHHLIDAYASTYGGYPQIVATGGDAPRLFAHDPLVEHVVPDLELLGIKAVCDVALAGIDHAEPDA